MRSIANATANVTLTTAINDGGNSGSGGAQSASDTTTLTINDYDLRPGETVSITMQGYSPISLRFLEADVDLSTDLLTGRSNPNSTVDITINGLWGELITRTVTADADHRFTSLHGVVALSRRR